MMLKKFVLSVILLFIVSYGITQVNDTADFEWLVSLNYSPDDSNPDASLSSSNHGDFHDGLARINAYEKGGYINTEGKLVIIFQSGIFHDFHDGLAPIKKGDYFGFINKKGEVVIEPQFIISGDDVRVYFSEGLADVNYNAYINKQGKQVIKFATHSLLHPFSEGLACVQVFDKWGYVNKQGRFLIKARYSEANDFHDGLARVAIDEDIFYIDKTGKVIFELPLGYNSGCHSCSNGNFFNGLLLVSKDNQYGYLNKKGEVVISPQFEYADDFHEGLAAVSNGNALFYIDTNGKTVFELPVGYSVPELAFFSEGLAIIIKDDKYGYMDKKGNVIIEPQFDEVHPFSGGFALVKKGDKRGYIKHPLNLK